MSPNDEQGRTLPQHGSGASFRPTEQHKVTHVSQEQDVSDSQPADGVFCTACPTEGEADWTIVYKDEHDEEFLQSDDEIAMKVMINEASTLLSVVTSGKAPTEGFDPQETSECSDRPSFALLPGFVMDRQREGGLAWRDHRLHPERVLRDQEAPHFCRCTRAQRFHPERDHCRVAARTQNTSPSSCRVHTKRGIC